MSPRCFSPPSRARPPGPTTVRLETSRPATPRTRLDAVAAALAVLVLTGAAGAGRAEAQRSGPPAGLAALAPLPEAVPAASCGPTVGHRDPVVARLAGLVGAGDPAGVGVLDELEPELREHATLAPDDIRAQYRLVSLLAARADLVQGRAALEVADELRARVLVLLALDPDHAGAHHVLGRLHAAGMRMGGFQRFVAGRLLGSDLVRSLSWEAARTHLERAERADPCVPDHHYELARLYAERGEPELARREIDHVFETTAAHLAPGRRVADKAERLRRRLAESS